MVDSRFKITYPLGILPNGNILVAGDGKFVELFDATNPEI
jgi:hypothetical protein